MPTARRSRRGTAQASAVAPDEAEEVTPQPKRTRRRASVPSVSPLDVLASPLLTAQLAPQVHAFAAQQDLQAAVDHVLAADPALQPVFNAHGLPTKLLPAQDGTCFEALAKSVVYQQLHGKAAACIYGRLVELCKSPLTPAAVLGASREDLRACGLSDRKADYIVSLAQLFGGTDDIPGLDDGTLLNLPDEQLIQLLSQVKGIGPWTVQMLLIFHLGRADVLPTADLGVRKGMQALYGLRELPDPGQMQAVASKWAPYRTIGSYLMWQVTDTLKPAPKTPSPGGKRQPKKQRQPRASPPAPTSADGEVDAQAAGSGEGPGAGVKKARGRPRKSAVAGSRQEAGPGSAASEVADAVAAEVAGVVQEVGVSEAAAAMH